MQLERVACREVALMPGNSLRTGTGDTFQLVDELAGLGFFSTLEVGVVQKVQGMELIVGVCAVLHSGFGGRCGGGEIRGNRLLPESQPGKDMRGHVQRV